MSHYSDTDLTAFLDGTLSEAKSNEILVALEEDPALEARLMTLDSVAARVADAFNDVGPQQSAEAFLPAANAMAPRLKTPLLIAACVGALMVVGVLFAFPKRSDEIAPWMHQVAAYQALYSKATVADVSFSDSEIAAQLARSERALNLDLRPQGLSNIAGLELKRAQLLAFEDQPLSQIVFSDEDGQPIALCVFEDESATTDGIAYAKLEGMESARFTVSGFSFLLIGPTDSASIESYASRIREIYAQT